VYLVVSSTIVKYQTTRQLVCLKRTNKNAIVIRETKQVQMAMECVRF